jgi:predicted secreted hydrolase
MISLMALRRTIGMASSLGAALALLMTPAPSRADSLQPSDGNGGRQCVSTLTGPINLPADDSVHPFSQYSFEWYYYSTHLVADDGREFGFVQIFYTLLDPTTGAPIQYVDSTITDVRAGSYHFGGRQYSFEAPAVIPDAFEFQIGTERARGGGGHDRVHSVVKDGAESYVVDLELDSLKTPVLHLADGYVNYYSRERMRAEGSMSFGGQVHHVQGTTWFDHQFGPQLIELSTVQNWTWIAAELTDDHELLVLVVNRQDGTQLVIGSYTDENCETTQLGAGDFAITALGTWAASASCVYPQGWNVTVPSKHLDLEVQPLVADQDILVPGQDHYYEGDSSVRGSAHGSAYVELYGFCAP